jgi:hypothetical protein
VAVLAAVAWGWAYSSLRSHVAKAGAGVLLGILSLMIVLDMAALHPYEYIYFNRSFGGLPAAHGRFDTEYFGLSMREGMEWIAATAGADVRVVSSRELHSSETFAPRGMQVFSMREYEETGVERPFFYIARPRFALQTRFAECPVVHAVERQDVPLTIVKRCG